MVTFRTAVIRRISAGSLVMIVIRSADVACMTTPGRRDAPALSLLPESIIESFCAHIMITKTFRAYRMNILHDKKCFRDHGIVRLPDCISRNWSYPSIMGIFS